ncbi:MAG: hypothetical protein IK016_06785 [Lachnospiraceae bacterium]|nr:hypothetical protein [Lachnospiraceae bacterium]
MNRLRVVFTVLALMLCCGTAFVAYTSASGRRISITDVAIATDTRTDSGRQIVRLSAAGEETEADIILPLPEDVHFEHLSFENRYMTKELLVRMETDAAHFYEGIAIPCDTDKVTGVRSVYTAASRTLDLSFQTEEILEPQVQVEEGEVRVMLEIPANTHKTVAVLDPAYLDTSDSALRLARAVSEKAAASGDGLRVYLTRSDVYPASEEACLRLTKDVSADRFLRLEVFDEGPLVATAYFHDGFFLRGYGNAELATDAELQLSGIAGLSAEGVMATQDAFALSSLKIPAATLRLTGLSGSEETIDAAAEAIYHSLLSGQEGNE